MDMSERSQSAQQGEDIRLCQVYPPPESETETDIDIIAIHGLDTKSPDTWVWRTNSPEERDINWLAQPEMLPDKAKRARIFYCNWPTKLFDKQSTIELTIRELARCLLLGITSRPRANKNRPLLFIASCLGGVILSQALVIAAQPENEYISVWKLTAGVVFLATPFRGTSFEDIATVAVPLLKVYASLKNETVTKLLESVTGSTLFLQDLVGDFTQICQQRDQPCKLAIFYETEKSNLLRKARFLNKPKVLVDSGSARLDIVPNPIPLRRTHVMMNKFYGPNDPGYIDVAGKIQSLLDEVGEASPLRRADNWIHYDHYTSGRLEIERLSGEVLSMEQCYMNLAIVEQSGERKARYKKGDAQQSSPFSLPARLKVETPDKAIQVDLRTIFEKRERPRHPTIEPRRILIRGRAGVGKTSLCKKIVYDFIYHNTWSNLFDRILWVPLRHLKHDPQGGYNLGDLLFQEYLSQTPKGKDLAHELWVALDATKYRRTLFVLDGLDEVSGKLDESSKLFPILKTLLQLPNVIITSRPHGSLPYWLKGTLDLELEAIGFYPDQVKAYVENAFANPETGEADPKNADEIQSFLQKHGLMQSLVRIPIQLDAMCYTWDDFEEETVPQSMTAVYQAIEQRLWKKDAVKLEKKTQAQMHDARLREIRSSVQVEIYFLEVLAFTGMHNDIIGFDPKHRDAIVEQFDPPKTDLFLDETLNRLSFLRTSDASSKDHNGDYHFLHLSYQEYFAARYFVRQWKAREPLICLMLSSSRKNEQIDPVEFLRRYKYHARYDILWRFVAGLLDGESEGESLRFFNVVDEQPLDLFGSTHQRLIMHCLSEVRHQFPLRSKLEGHLSKWLIFQCKKLRGCDQDQDFPWQNKRFLWPNTLASEIEFPEQAIVDALQEEENEVKMMVLGSIISRQNVPGRVTEIVTSWLQGEIPDRLTIYVLDLFRSSRDQLPDNTFKAIAARLDDQVPGIRRAAIDALETKSNLPEETLNQIAARLNDQDWGVKMATTNALRSQSNLPEGTLDQIAARLKDQEWVIRSDAIDVLAGQSKPQEGTLNQIAARLEDSNQQVRIAASDALGRQSNLSEGTLNQIATRFEHQDPEVRKASIDAFRGQPHWPEGAINAIVAQLEDQNFDVRIASINTLGSQSKVPEETLNQIAARLNDQDWDVKMASINTLKSQSNLPQGTLNAIAAQLEHQRPEVRMACINFLTSRSNLPEGTLSQIAARVDQTNLAGGTPNQIAAWLEDPNQHVRIAASDVLGRQSNLPEVTLNQIAAQLEDSNQQVRIAASDALGRQSNLSEGTLNQIATRFEHQDPEVRKASLTALGRQSTLSQETLHQIAARLKDPIRWVRTAAIYALGRQSNLQEVTLNQIAARLKDPIRWVRIAAINVLGRQSNLQEVTLNQIAARLEDQDGTIRRITIGVLGRQPNLPEGTLNQIAVQLKDLEPVEPLISMLIERQEFHSVCLVGGHAQGLFPLLLERSFRSHLAWCIQDGKSCLATDNHLRIVRLLYGQTNLEVTMRRAQEDAAIPAVAVSHEAEGTV
ncbi:hypothetical protein N7467_006038 [Penicillium canescens]|nr:hypothetical protein N7467_006038 [Penicillium canescens]